MPNIFNLLLKIKKTALIYSNQKEHFYSFEKIAYYDRMSVNKLMKDVQKGKI